MNVEIIDTTLRDGEQAPGVCFTSGEKLVIAEKLISLGIDEIEAGIPAMGRNEFDFISTLASFSNGSRISAWSRLVLSDVKEVLRTGADTVHISIPVSSYHLPYQLGSWDKLKIQLNEVLSYAQDHFKRVSIGLQDSFRTDRDRLLELCSLAEERKLYRVRFSDTVGNAFPDRVKELITYAKTLYSGVIDFHGHNDLGLAAANSLAALESGADSINVTVNGIGERAGNAALEQMAFIINQHPLLNSKLDLKKIRDLSITVSHYSGRAIPVDKPIIGSNVFTHESGVHCHGMLRNPLAYQPFRPEEVGLAESKIVVGSHSGKSNIRSILSNAGFNIRGEDVSKFMSEFKSKAAEKNNFLTAEEVIDIYREMTMGRVL